MTERYIVELEENEWKAIIGAVKEMLRLGEVDSRTLEKFECAETVTDHLDGYCRDCERINPEDAAESCRNEGYE